MSDDRRLIYYLVSLNYIKRRELFAQFTELSEESMKLNDSEFILKTLTQIRDEGKLDIFRTAVFDRQEREKKDAK